MKLIFRNITSGRNDSDHAECLSVYYLYVCPHAYLRNHTFELCQIFCASCLWSWLIPILRLRLNTSYPLPVS